MWIVLGFILWLIYDEYKDRKNEKELQEIKQNCVNQSTEKGGGSDA